MSAGSYSYQPSFSPRGAGYGGTFGLCGLALRLVAELGKNNVVDTMT